MTEHHFKTNTEIQTVLADILAKPLGRPFQNSRLGMACAPRRARLDAIGPAGNPTRMETHVSSSRDTYSIGNLMNRFDFALTKTLT